MSEHQKSWNKRAITANMHLLLDRDGVINMPKADDYVKHPDEFEMIHGTIEALRILRNYFDGLAVVTNQQGIDRKLMSVRDLEDIHLKMHDILTSEGIPYFDFVAYAPYLRTENHSWRKPGIGMAQKIMDYFQWKPENIVLCGDSPGDMAMGRKLGAICICIENPQFEVDDFDYRFGSLSEFAHFITQT